MVFLQIEPQSRRSEWRKLVSLRDLEPGCRGLAFRIEPLIGYSRARERPLDDFLLAAKLQWNEAVRPICAYYTSLRNAHNAAAVTVKEFKDRKAELRGAVRALKARKLELKQAFAEYEAQLDTLETLRWSGRDAADEMQKARDGMAVARELAAALLEQARKKVEDVGHQRPAPDIIAGAAL